MSNKTDIDDSQISGPRKPRLDLLKKSDKSDGLDIHQLLISCIDQPDFDAAAIYLVNMLAFKLQCDRVSIGMLSGNHIQLSALSNSAKFDPKTNFIRGITAAMNESIDESSTIVFPSSDNQETSINVAHQQLTKLQNDRSVCTIPLRHQGRNIGALCLEHTGNKRFNVAGVKRAEEITQLIGPLLYLLHQEERSLKKRLFDYLQQHCTNTFGRDKVVSGIVGISVIFLLTFLTFVSANYRVTADAVMEGSVQRIVAAPIAGYISTANKRAGDIVTTGDLIATLDDRELTLKSIQLKSEKQQLQREYRESLASNDRSKVSILNSKSNQLNAKLELVEEQLSRLKLTSPINGIITDGNLNQSIGSPVARGDVLFKISPLDDYRVILNVDESEISQLKNGQSGQLALSALPNGLLGFNVTKITPVSSSSDGRTFFRVEAQLSEAYEHLQPGMEGIAKVNIGDRKLMWVLTHSALERLRLLFWYLWL